MNDIKHFVDAVSVTTVIATVVGWMPSIAAATSILWTIIRIYETETVQNLLHRRKAAQVAKENES